MSVKTNYFRILALFLLSMVTIQQSNAQKYLEGGLLIGASNYNGDLSGKFMNLSNSRLAAGVLLRYNLSPRFTLKGYLGYGRIVGADSMSSVDYHKQRNLSFFTDIYELSGHIEYNFIPYKLKRYSSRPFVPYVFTGIAVFNFNPKTNYGGEVYELQPLGTEGQGSTEYNNLEKYTLTQFAIPLGFGVKKRIAERWTLGFEIGARYTFTNYLDDVGGVYASQQIVSRSNGEIAGILSDRSAELNGGVPTFNEGDKRSNKSIDAKDIYVFAGVTVTFRLKKKIQCPTF